MRCGAVRFGAVHCALQCCCIHPAMKTQSRRIAVVIALASAISLPPSSRVIGPVGTEVPMHTNDSSPSAVVPKDNLKDPLEHQPPFSKQQPCKPSPPPPEVFFSFGSIYRPSISPSSSVRHLRNQIETQFCLSLKRRDSSL